MKEISSRANPLFRQWLKERTHAGRTGHLVWLEGPHLCRAWLQNDLPVQWFVVDQARLNDPEIIDIWNQIESERRVVLASGLFDALSEVKSHQGALLMVPLHPKPLSNAIQSNTVLLDGVQDPGNVGTILRSCAAVGVSTVITTTGTAACWSPKVLRSAQGAHAGLVIHEAQDLQSWLAQYCQQPARLPIIATTLEESRSLYQVCLPNKAIWIFGSEGQGVSPSLLELADLRVRIDHDTQYVESLNVGTAVALCLFEQARQHSN